MSVIFCSSLFLGLPAALLTFTGKKWKSFYVIAMGFFACNILMRFPLLLMNEILYSKDFYLNMGPRLAIMMDLSLALSFSGLCCFKISVFLGSAGLGAFLGSCIRLEGTSALISMIFFYTTVLVFITAGLTFAYFQEAISIQKYPQLFFRLFQLFRYLFSQR